MLNFQNIWNIKAYFGETFLQSILKYTCHRKPFSSAFYCFLFHKNILYTFEVIALLLTAYIIAYNNRESRYVYCPTIYKETKYVIEQCCFNTVQHFVCATMHWLKENYFDPAPDRFECCSDLTKVHSNQIQQGLWISVLKPHSNFYH